MSEAWNEQVASEILGASVVVGLTFNKPDGQLDHHEQMHGRVGTADVQRGICVHLEGHREGEMFWLPPDTRSVFRASPGEYRLKSTGEVVSNPDFTLQYTITLGD